MSEASHDLNRLLDKPGLGEGPAGYENSFLSFTGAPRLLNGVLSLALVAVMTFTALGEVERTFWIDFVLRQAKRVPRLAGAEGRTWRAAAEFTSARLRRLHRLVGHSLGVSA